MEPQPLFFSNFPAIVIKHFFHTTLYSCLISSLLYQITAIHLWAVWVSYTQWLQISEFLLYVSYIKNIGSQSPNFFPLYSNLALNHLSLICQNLALCCFPRFIKKFTIPLLSLSYLSKSAEEGWRPKHFLTTYMLSFLHTALCLFWKKKLLPTIASSCRPTNPWHWGVPGILHWMYMGNVWVLSNLNTTSMQEPWECKNFSCWSVGGIRCPPCSTMSCRDVVGYLHFILEPQLPVQCVQNSPSLKDMMFNGSWPSQDFIQCL